MFRWFNNAGFQANIPELRRKYPEVHLRTLEEWLRDEGWHKHARHVRAPKGYRGKDLNAAASIYERAMTI